jgi:phospholipid-binding lipoprotein MlaA
MKRLSHLIFSALLLPVLPLPALADTSEKDPWERFNRGSFAVNNFLDRWLLKPVAVSYRFITPDPLETGIANAFANALEPANILNDVLQWKWKAAGRDLGRFVVNTTAGLGGLIDVADQLGWTNTGGEDFGQTLRQWGVPEGPYVVLPLMGPSTLTDAVALPVDFFTDPVSYTESVRAYNSLTALKITHKRAGFLDAEALISGDKYTFIREAYLQNREFKTQDGKVVDDFGTDSSLEDL